MVLQYFKKKENKEKQYALSKYKNILEKSNNFIKSNKFFKKQTFNTSFEIVSIILLIHIKTYKDQKYPKYKIINEYLVNNFVSDLDESLRINGIGDMSIGKYVKSYVKKFYYRLSIFDKLSKNPNKDTFYDYLSNFDIVKDDKKKDASRQLDLICNSIKNSLKS
tara:strand:+ start:382 stop:873 length:492 start_codon:yes stop_codon:yes gene_type:complete